MLMPLPLPGSSSAGLLGTTEFFSFVMLFDASIEINSETNVSLAFTMRIKTIQQVTTEKVLNNGIRLLIERSGQVRLVE
jgi:hypothetical protein